jgi:hypothetical protein
MSSVHRAPNSNTSTSVNRLGANANHVGRRAAASSRTVPTREHTPAKLFRELSPSERAARVTNNRPCATHGGKRTEIAGPPAPTKVSTRARPPREVLPPVEVVRHPSIGSAGATRRRTRRSARESLEEAFYECQENSVGFLTPSLNQSHSDPSCWDDDDPSDKRIRFFCCHLPRIHLPQHRPSPCLWHPVAKDEPRMVDARIPTTHKNVPTGVGSRKSFAMSSDEVKRSLGRMRSVPTAPVGQGRKVESMGRNDSISTVRHSKLSGCGRGNGALSSITTKRNHQGNIKYQVELPTIVTLRRAIAVLNTLAQPQIHDFGADMNNSAMLREYRRSIRSMASPAEYLITSEEIRGLTNLLQRRFIEPSPNRSAVVK